MYELNRVVNTYRVSSNYGAWLKYNVHFLSIFTYFDPFDLDFRELLVNYFIIEPNTNYQYCKPIDSNKKKT